LQLAVESKKRTRSEIGEHIGIDYYGFRDEDDGLLLDLERQAESKLAKTQKTASAEVLRAHVPLPNEDEIRATLLARRKQALLDQLK
jgi:pre-mRNA-splicing factor ISY1